MRYTALSNDRKTLFWHALRTGTLLSLALFYLSIVSFTPSPFSSERMNDIDLLEGVRNGKLSLQVRGTGSSSSECLSLSVRNLSSTALRVHIPPGTHFENPDVQDILCTRELYVNLAPNSEDELSVYGFCMEPFESTPSENSEFSAKKGETHWVALAQHLQSSQLSPDQEQSAVWACTEDYPLGGLYIDQDSHPELAGYISDLRGEALPEYTLDYGEIIDRPFRQELKEVRGTMQHRPRSSGLANLVVLDPSGDVVMTIFENRSLDPSANYRFRFNIQGSSLETGTYLMRLTVDRAVEKEIEIRI